MKLRECSVENFGSYKSLEFDFSSLGLALVYGRTGSGKSTLADLAPWILFATTAKDGNVDEVRSWQSNGEPTTGSLTVETSTGSIVVTRVRGSAKQNDLYWTEGDSVEPKRGKDVNDTQKLLEKRLGVSADTYLTGAYFHEFSTTGAFFTAKAKDRRAVFERIADLALPTRLADRTATARKEAKKAVSETSTKVARLTARAEQILHDLKATADAEDRWSRRRSVEIAALRDKSASFEADRADRIKQLEDAEATTEKTRAENVNLLEARLEEARTIVYDLGKLQENFAAASRAVTNFKTPSPCPTCGGSLGADELYQLKVTALSAGDDLGRAQRHARELSDIKRELDMWKGLTNPHVERKVALLGESNTYADQAEAKAAESNPFCDRISELTESCAAASEAEADAKAELAKAERRASALDRLYDIAAALRGALFSQSISAIEKETNRYLEKYFDAEIRVKFSLDADSLEVEIQKSGYDCVYRQLSKGQRQMLRLSFAIAVMDAASSRAGIHFDNLYFDEALDGLDTSLKLKVFALFDELATEHGSILVIDHCEELHSLFGKRYLVTLEGDVSHVELQDGA